MKMTNSSQYNQNNNTIVLFTANYKGGILQFALHLAKVLAGQGYSVCVFMPEQTSDSIQLDPHLSVSRYRRFKSLRAGNRSAAELARRILACVPERVLFCDDSMISAQTMLALDSKIKASVFIHDITPHPTDRGLYETLKQFLVLRYRRRIIEKALQIIMLSENSREKFTQHYHMFKNKATVMLLGAHIPSALPVKPPELNKTDTVGYYLFFGRISRYKGLTRLLEAYTRLAMTDKPILIIAGEGDLQDTDKSLITQNSGIVLINRYITDAEMLHLIKNALSVVLPYIEASQSGVIPIAYHLGVPVITSNVPGLAEFVEHGVSGIVCADIEQLGNALVKMTDPAYRNMLGEGAFDFNQRRLNWDMNVKNSIDLPPISERRNGGTAT